MEFQTLLKQLQTRFDEQEKKHRAQLKAIREEHADRLSAIDSIVAISQLDRVISRAKSEGIDINTFLLEVVIKGLAEKTGVEIPVSHQVYEALMALARGRGIDLQTLTHRDGFLEYIQRGVKMGAF